MPHSYYTFIKKNKVRQLLNFNLIQMSRLSKLIIFIRSNNNTFLNCSIAQDGVSADEHKQISTRIHMQKHHVYS